jgi:hypothetical protein
VASGLPALLIFPELSLRLAPRKRSTSCLELLHTQHSRSLGIRRAADFAGASRSNKKLRTLIKNRHGRFWPCVLIYSPKTDDSSKGSSRWIVYLDCDGLVFRFATPPTVVLSISLSLFSSIWNGRFALLPSRCRSSPFAQWLSELHTRTAQGKAQVTGVL